MKNPFILAILLLAVIGVKAQTFTADEMIMQVLRCQSFDCINDFLLTKNFRLSNSTNMSGSMLYTFRGDINSVEKCPDALFSEGVVVIFYGDNGRRSILYSTSSITCYQKLKDRFLQKGFEYKEEHTSEDPTKAEKKLYQGVVSTLFSKF